MFTRDKKPKTQNTSKTEKNKDLFIQPKLSFGKSGDAHEVEADKMAEKVVNKPTETKKVQKKEGEEDVQAKPLAAEATPVLQRKESSEEDPVQKMEEEETVQSKEEEESVQKMEEEEAVQSKEDEELQSKEAVKKSTKQKASFESKLRRGSGGQKLDKKVRNEMEAGFGSSFNHIKIHNDSEAAEMSKNIGAQAFTHGNDIYFNKGKYNPNSKEGKTLLAHELTHTIQQKGMVQRQEEKRVAQSVSRPTSTELVDEINTSTFDKKHDCVQLAKKLTKRIQKKKNKGLQLKTITVIGNKNLKEYSGVIREQRKGKKADKAIGKLKKAIEKEKKKNNLRGLKKLETELIIQEAKYDSAINTLKEIHKTKKYKELKAKNSPFCEAAKKIKQQPKITVSGSTSTLEFIKLKKVGKKIVEEPKTIELKEGMKIYTAEKCDMDNTWNNQHMVIYAGNGKVIDRINPKSKGKLRELRPVYISGSDFFIVLKVIDDYNIKK